MGILKDILNDTDPVVMLLCACIYTAIVYFWTLLYTPEYGFELRLYSLRNALFYARLGHHHLTCALPY